MTEHWIIDKSGYVRLNASLDADVWLTRINRGLVRIATVTLLEMGFLARSAPDWRIALREPPAANLPVEHLTPGMESRAVEVQGMLADRGHHRAPSVPDVVISAIAELSRLSVLHLDKDFDLIAGITGQPVERLRA